MKPSIPAKLPILGLVLCLLIVFTGIITAASPSRVLELRDTDEEIAVGLGETSGLVRISSTKGVQIATGEGETLGEFQQAIRVAGETGESPQGQRAVWRVQIKAVRNEEAALALRHQVEIDSGVAAYVVHVEPWYKVQVGDGDNAADAEALKERLITLGYQDAWVTRVEPAQEDTIADLPNEGSFLRIEDDAGRLLTTVKCSKLMIKPIGDHALVVELPNSPKASYRGCLCLTFLGKGRLRVVNMIGLEEYLYGVVGAELYSKNKDDLAALAAQAVAARTYAVENLGKHATEGYDLCATVHCQVYQGIERESQLIQQAVDMTAGQILTYGGQTISAVYHSSSGGSTAGAEQVWSTRYSGYLRPRPDEAVDPKTGSLVKLGQDRPGYSWEVEWQGGKLSDSLRRYLQSELSIRVPSTAVLKDLKVGKKDALGRAEQLVISYQEPMEADATRALEYEVTKDKIRWVLRRPDGRILPSTRFDLKVERHDGEIRRVVATGQGNGHGLGLSQAGAVHMSRLGYGYKEILQHYYTNVTLVALAEYYKSMEHQLAWERKGLVQSWVAILGPEQGIDELTHVIKWSPAGDLIAYGTGGDGGGLWIFHAITGEKARILAEPILEVAWKSDGSVLAAVCGTGSADLKRLYLIELGTNSSKTEEVAAVEALSTSVLAQAVDLHSPGWFADSDLLFFGQNRMIYGAQDGLSVPLLTDAETPALTADGKQVAFSRQGAVWVYQLTTGIPERLCWIGKVQSLLWSPDGEHLAVTTDRDLVVINVHSKEIVARLPGDSPTWSADGYFLAYVGREQDSTIKIHLWEPGSKESLVLASSQSDGREAVNWSARGNALAYTIDGKLHLLTLR
ncbi:MAG: SpoIID/LytB domain-containing protein [Firmicutes bacterium]|nr:SpoIID/LytB domain-containing protein [Bacillota bacterium]